MNHFKLFLFCFLSFLGFSPAKATSPVATRLNPHSALPAFYEKSSIELIQDYQHSLLEGCHPNKKLIFNAFLQQKPPREALITISACSNVLDPKSRDVAMFLTSLAQPLAFKSSCRQEFFPYTQKTANPKELLVTLNFADGHLFGYYKTGLLAQDELQVLEFPELALVREFFKHQNPGLLDANQTSFIIHNTQRFCSLNLKKSNLYGNNFHKAKTTDVLHAMHHPSPPQTATILPIVAPNACRQPIYTSQTIQLFLKNLVVGFAHAARFAKRIGKESIAIHTGKLGTGAFGNNTIVSVFLQLIAAQAVAGTLDKNTFSLTFYHTDAEILTAATSLFNEFQTQLKHKPSYSVETVTDVILQLCAKYNLTPHSGTGE